MIPGPASVDLLMVTESPIGSAGADGGTIRSKSRKSNSGFGIASGGAAEAGGATATSGGGGQEPSEAMAAMAAVPGSHHAGIDGGGAAANSGSGGGGEWRYSTFSSDSEPVMAVMAEAAMPLGLTGRSERDEEGNRSTRTARW